MGRPDRIRLTLTDDARGSTPLDLPSRRMWPAGMVCAIFFAIFAAIAWMQVVKISASHVRGVSDLMFVLFNAFWVLGWSVGVVVLGAGTVLFFCYRESVRLENGRLVHVPQLGPLRIICEYDLARIQNVRVESGSRSNVRIRFDCDGGTSGIGDWMPRAAAERLIERINTAIRQNHPRSDLPSEGHACLRETVFVAVNEQRTPEVPLVSSVLRYALARPGLRQNTSERSAAAAPVSVSQLVLVMANVLPLLGVVFLGWNLSSVMVLYWAESAVIAFYTVLKIFVVGKWIAPFAGVFFIGHFGGFMAAHFLFVYSLFVRGIDASGSEPAARDALIGIFAPLWPALLALVVSHGVSFVANFLAQREYEGTTVPELMAAPYKRIMVMHLTVILGGWLVLALKTPMAALVLLVVLKTAVDFRAHAREHTVALNRLEASPAH